MRRGVGSKKRTTTPRNNQHNPQCANSRAPRTRKRHQQEHGPQRPPEHSDPTQHAKGRTGDCPGPRKETATQRNVTQGGGEGRGDLRPRRLCTETRPKLFSSMKLDFPAFVSPQHAATCVPLWTGPCHGAVARHRVLLRTALCTVPSRAVPPPLSPCAAPRSQHRAPPPPPFAYTCCRGGSGKRSQALQEGRQGRQALLRDGGSAVCPVRRDAGAESREAVPSHLLIGDKR